MSNPRYAKLVQGLPATVPFVGPETQERDRGSAFDARLGANENIFGPSPKAIAAFNTVASDIWMYGDPTSFDLRQALSTHLGCAMGNVVVGEGIDGLLGYLVRLLVDAGDHVVTSDGAYPTFNYHVAGFGGTLHKVPYKDDKEDLPALLAKAAEVDAKLVYFANPDNPMGSWTAGAEIEAALNDIPSGTVLLLDEAYVEFAAHSGMDLAIARDNVVVTRSLSKSASLAGIRFGYAVGPAKLIGALYKIKDSYNVNSLTQACVLAALESWPEIEKQIKQVQETRDRTAGLLRDRGYEVAGSSANFLWVQPGDIEAEKLHKLLQSRGILVRFFCGAATRGYVRITVGTDEEMEILLQALDEINDEKANC